jgi:AcrR family transcriptional regulator
MGTTRSLAERKRQLVRDELSKAALQAFAFKGFEETTIDQITAAAGVSRRTFFRYFKTKEDVIIEFLSEVGQLVPAALAARPAGETPQVSLRQAFNAILDPYVEHPEKSIRLAKLILETPALRARYLDHQYEWQVTLVAEYARRTGLDPDTDLRPAVTVGIAMAAFDAAIHRWVRRGGNEDLHHLADQAFALTAPALGL